MNPQLTAWQQLRTRTLSVERVRAVDAMAIDKYGMPSLVLMENAALGCVDWLCKKFPSPQPTTLLCGRGNNGGDGLAIARHLINHGWPCSVIQLGPIGELSADARANFRILTIGHGLAIYVTEEPLKSEMKQSLRNSTVIIDALLGTGSRGAPRAPIDDWIDRANRCTAFRTAIDLPTGIDAETGQAAGVSFYADATLTFVAKKPAMNHPHAESIFGEIEVLPIGIPAQMMLEILSHC